MGYFLDILASTKQNCNESNFDTGIKPLYTGLIFWYQIDLRLHAFPRGRKSITDPFYPAKNWSFCLTHFKLLYVEPTTCLVS